MQQSEPTPGTVPVHHRIADALRQQMDSGELRPGDPLPSARELQEQWGCSSITVRSAMSVLKGEGRIIGGRGRNVRVREPAARQQITLSSDWADQQKSLVLAPRAERSKQGAIELISGIPISDTRSTYQYDTIGASAELAREFNIEPGSDLQQRTYEMRNPETGIRLSFSISYIPLAIIEANPDLLTSDNEPWPGGHQHQLYTVGIEIDRFSRSIYAIEPTPADREHWAMAEGVPLLQVRSRSIDITGRVVELSDATYPADRTEIEVEEKLTRWPDNYPRYNRLEGDQ